MEKLLPIKVIGEVVAVDACGAAAVNAAINLWHSSRLANSLSRIAGISPLNRALRLVVVSSVAAAAQAGTAECWDVE